MSRRTTSIEEAIHADQLSRDNATFNRLREAISGGDAELISKTIDEVFEPDGLISTPLPVEATGAQALKEVFAMLHRALPDLHAAVEDVIAEGDKVVCRNTVTGTHPRRVYGRLTNRHIYHVQGDPHRPLHRRPNR